MLTSLFSLNFGVGHIVGMILPIRASINMDTILYCHTMCAYEDSRVLVIRVCRDFDRLFRVRMQIFGTFTKFKGIYSRYADKLAPSLARNNVKLQ